LKLRKIKLKVLLLQGLGYRIFVALCCGIFIYALTGDKKLATSASIGWSLINMVLYYLYHYVFLRFVKMGRD